MNGLSRIRKHVITVNLCGNFRLHKNVYSVLIEGDLFGYTCGGRWIVLSEILNKIETQIRPCWMTSFSIMHTLPLRDVIRFCVGRFQGHLFSCHCTLPPIASVCSNQRRYILCEQFWRAQESCLVLAPRCLLLR